MFKLKSCFATIPETAASSGKDENKQETQERHAGCYQSDEAYVVPKCRTNVVVLVRQI